MEKDFFMESEIKNYFKVWIMAFISLNYCYFIPSKITKEKFRFISVLPVIILFIILPLNLTTISLGGTTDFFLAWLCNFKLLLFSFDKGPLSSHQSISLSHFILIACLPINIKQENSPKSSTNQIRPKSPLNFALKGLGIALLTALYQHSQNIHSKIMFVYYCCYLYLSLELLLVMIAGLVRTTLGLELEPQFDEPYLSTSLQDFWGHRWNLMVPNILRPTVYEPVRSIATHILGRKWALLPAVLAAFLTSGLMHELIFFYMGRLSPTWEVTSFFLLQGVCVVLEILVKKMLKDRWRLHPLISGLLTIGFVMVTTYWLFFPPTARFNMVFRSSIEASFNWRYVMFMVPETKVVISMFSRYGLLRNKNLLLLIKEVDPPNDFHWLVRILNCLGYCLPYLTMLWFCSDAPLQYIVLVIRDQDQLHNSVEVSNQENQN